MRYRRLTKRGAHRDAQVPGEYPVWAVGIIVFIKSKIACAVPLDSSPRNLTLCVRRRATGKGKGCVLSSTKINILFRTIVIFDEKMSSFFNLANKWTKTRGLFFDLPLVSLIAPPLSLVSLLLWREIGNCFLAPLGVRSVSGPSGQCALAHDALARGDAHPRLAHSASFHFFAFTPHAQPTELLTVMGEGFVFPLSIPEGEGSSLKSSPTKHCRSIICTHRVKR